MSALDGNASSYSLPANEKYSYEVSADGYVGKSGYFTADGAKEIKSILYRQELRGTELRLKSRRLRMAFIK